MKRSIRLSLLTVSLFLSPAFAQDAKITKGDGKFTFVDEKAYKDKPIPVWTYAPEGLKPDAPIIFVMHGTGRNSDGYLRSWKPQADQYKFLLVVPEFSEELFPQLMYQRGNLFDKNDKPVDPEKWTYASIERIFDRVKELSGNTSPKYLLYGHSAGGQFVHRFCLFMPNGRYDRAITANSGWYTLPSPRIAWPYGLSKTSATKDSLKTVLGRDVTVLRGDQDTNRGDPDLQKNAETDQQGLVRFERGQFFYHELLEISKRYKTPLNWKLRVVPGVGHSDRLMSPAAAAVFFNRELPKLPKGAKED